MPLVIRYYNLVVFRVLWMVSPKVTAGPAPTWINNFFTSFQKWKLSRQVWSCCDIVPQKTGVGGKKTAIRKWWRWHKDLWEVSLYQWHSMLIVNVLVLIYISFYFITSFSFHLEGILYWCIHCILWPYRSSQVSNLDWNTSVQSSDMVIVLDNIHSGWSSEKPHLIILFIIFCEIIRISYIIYII